MVTHPIEAVIHRFLSNTDFDFNLLLYLLEDDFKKSDEDTFPDLITHSYYCCS